MFLPVSQPPHTRDEQDRRRQPDLQGIDLREAAEIIETVLVVEDEVFIRMLTVASLEDAGFYVLEAANGAEAMKMMDAHAEVSVLVTDVRMPGAMDGLALVSRTQRNFPRVRAIVVSGNATAADAFKAGAAGFVAKPYSADSIVKAVCGLFAQPPGPHS